MALTEIQRSTFYLVKTAASAGDPLVGLAVDEAQLALHQSHDGTRAKLYDALRKDLGLENSEAYWSSDFYITAVFETSVVYHYLKSDWRREYTVEGDKAILNGAPNKVELSYVDLVNESATLTPGSTTEHNATIVRESVSKNTGDGLIRIIAPGQGSSGYYPKAVIERDGPKIFKTGTRMYWNHATEDEDTTRPEGDLNREAGVLTSDAYFDQNGPLGPGCYAKYKAYSEFKDRIAERAQFGTIEISWKGWVTKTSGQVAGKATEIIQSMTAAESVDFVTRAGAGGGIAKASEGALKPQKVGTMPKVEIDETELATLRASAGEAQTTKAKLEQLSKDARESQAKGLINLKLKDLPEKSRESLSAVLMRNLPVTDDGFLDTKAFEAELDGIAAGLVSESTGASSSDGKVRAGGENPAGGQQTAKESREKRIQRFQGIGYTKEAAERAVLGGE